MGLVIFVILAITAVVLVFLIALGRISFVPSMIIFAILIIVCLILISIFVPIGLIMKVCIIAAIIPVVLGIVSYLTASGLTSLFWWLNKDTTPIEKEKMKICPECRTENMIGRLFCVKCGKRLIHARDIDTEDLKISGEQKASSE